MRVLEGGRGDDEPRRGRPSGAAIDPWGVEEGQKYSPDVFYTRSTNSHDHSLRIEVRIPPHIHGQMQSVVDRVPNYRSLADMARDSIVHRLKYLTPEYGTPEMEMWLEVEMRTARAEALKVQLMQLDALIGSHRESLEMADRVGDATGLGIALGFVEDDAGKLDEPYAGVLREMARGYRGRLKVMKKAGVEE